MPARTWQSFSHARLGPWACTAGRAGAFIHMADGGRSTCSPRKSCYGDGVWHGHAHARIWRLARPSRGLGARRQGSVRTAQVKQVCHLVARRSAAVVAACLAGLLKQIDRDGTHTPMAPTTIAVDGGLFEHYQAYRGYLREYLDQMLGKQVLHACHDLQ